MSSGWVCSLWELGALLRLWGLREPHTEGLREQSLDWLPSMELSSVGAEPGPQTPAQRASGSGRAPSNLRTSRTEHLVLDVHLRHSTGSLLISGKGSAFRQRDHSIF